MPTFSSYFNKFLLRKVSKFELNSLTSFVYLNDQRVLNIESYDNNNANKYLAVPNTETNFQTKNPDLFDQDVSLIIN